MEWQWIERSVEMMESMERHGEADRICEIDYEIQRLATVVADGIANLAVGPSVLPIVMAKVSMLAQQQVETGIESRDELSESRITKLTPEQLEAARHEFTDEEYLAEYRDVQQNGGVGVDELLLAIEKAKQQL
jgi:hypothetical protein